MSARVSELTAMLARARVANRDLRERVATLTDERDQALIRAEAAEAELEAYREFERKLEGAVTERKVS